MLKIQFDSEKSFFFGNMMMKVIVIAIVWMKHFTAVIVFVFSSFPLYTLWFLVETVAIVIVVVLVVVVIIIIYIQLSSIVIF